LVQAMTVWLPEHALIGRTAALSQRGRRLFREAITPAFS
jgi:hypothetical protein